MSAITSDGLSKATIKMRDLEKSRELLHRIMNSDGVAHLSFGSVALGTDISIPVKLSDYAGLRDALAGQVRQTVATLRAEVEGCGVALPLEDSR